jgi:hypothetical protein
VCQKYVDAKKTDFTPTFDTRDSLVSAKHDNQSDMLIDNEKGS